MREMQDMLRAPKKSRRSAPSGPRHSGAGKRSAFRLVAPLGGTLPSEKGSVLRFSYARSLRRVSIENGWELEGAEHMATLVAVQGV